MNDRDARESKILYRDFLKLFSLLSLFHFSYFTKMIKGKGEEEFHERNLNNDFFMGKKLRTRGTKLQDQTVYFLVKTTNKQNLQMFPYIFIASFRKPNSLFSKCDFQIYSFKRKPDDGGEKIHG